jgi:hypothetical protein
MFFLCQVHFSTEYLSHTETHHSVQCPPLNETGAVIGCPETTLDGQQRRDFPRINSGTRGAANANHLEMRGATHQEKGLHVDIRFFAC